MSGHDAEEVAADLDRYMMALAAWDDHGVCAEIEQKYGLYGYPPEIVSKVMAAGARGEDMKVAEDQALGKGAGDAATEPEGK